MRKPFFLAVTAILTAVLVYLSRLWFLSLWPRPGLLGIEALRPQGGLLGRWLRGTEAAPFELIIWAVGCFLVLTLAQKLYDRLTPKPDAGDDHG
ncbi:hypothetical protein [Ruegeria hyattellae]|uniref:hypothetical protein n=1 Tax=Ruegeria hyattellae TaxID=3233337 RepID=UPI00355B9D33